MSRREAVLDALFASLGGLLHDELKALVAPDAVPDAFETLMRNLKRTGLVTSRGGRWMPTMKARGVRDAERTKKKLSSVTVSAPADAAVVLRPSRDLSRLKAKAAIAKEKAAAREAAKRKPVAKKQAVKAKSPSQSAVDSLEEIITKLRSDNRPMPDVVADMLRKVQVDLKKRSAA